MSNDINEAAAAVNKVLQIRAKIEELQASIADPVKQLKAAEKKLISAIIAPALENEEVKRISASNGTGYVQHQKKYSCGDVTRLHGWVVDRVKAGDTDALNIFTKAVSKSFVTQYIEDHDGADIPDGVQVAEWDEVKIRTNPGK